MPECRSDRYISDPNLIDILARSLEEVIQGLRKPVLPSLAACGTANGGRQMERGRSEPRPPDEQCNGDQESHVTRSK
ncbi:hypothetical protein SAMN05421548_102237 [Paraburkholderia lycopersici]|uniref:Uncharacterized protein n=1 Tax=Paraburkholderia lycopersici TaxID=416944 RepID=A0A1G6HED7_9BURK|nr:hypothetical protein SAMN05421548_102237 [Paraburkholderia lycopersici]